MISGKFQSKNEDILDHQLKEIRTRSNHLFNRCLAVRRGFFAGRNEYRPTSFRRVRTVLSVTERLKSCTIRFEDTKGFFRTCCLIFQSILAVVLRGRPPQCTVFSDFCVRNFLIMSQMVDVGILYFALINVYFVPALKSFIICIFVKSLYLHLAIADCNIFNTVH